MALDFCLSTLCVEDDGSLLGTSWLKALRGSTMHADGNAARNIGRRRALSIGSVFQSKATVLV